MKTKIIAVPGLVMERHLAIFGKANTKPPSSDVLLYPSFFAVSPRSSAS
jgi:hypothetical protein